MGRRRGAFALVVLAAVVIAGCAVSLAEAGDHHRTACDGGITWGPAKSAAAAASIVLADLPLLAAASGALAPPAGAAEFSAPDRDTPGPPRVASQPRIPRAPPLA